jgi:hypothetical protein
MPLIKTTIPLGQCEHFNQIGPSKKSHLLVMMFHAKTLLFTLEMSTFKTYLGLVRIAKNMAFVFRSRI